MCRMGVLFAAFLVLAVTASAELESNFRYEEACSAIKGLCVLEKECPGPIEKDERDLCPSQKELGAVCCKNIPQEEANCFQQHNECRESCPKALILGRKGCPPGNTCCVLV